MRKFFNAVFRVAGAIVGLAVLVYAAAVLWNLRDEQPSADALRLTALYEAGAAIADDDNAFVYFLGFQTPSDQSPRAAGARRLAWLRSTGDAPLEQAADPLTSRTEIRADSAVEQFLALCSIDSGECATGFADSGAVLEKWTAQEPWLLERYREFIAHDGWREHVPTVNEAWGRELFSVRRGQRLLLLHAKQLADTGDSAAVRELLGRDARFWRMMLGSADTLLTKMAAVSALREHFQWGSLAVRTLPPGSMSAAIPAEWQTPMTAEELALGQALAGESTLVSLGRIPEDVLASASLLRRAVHFALEPLSRRQARTNRRAAVITALIDLLDAPLLELDTIVAELGSLSRRSTGPLPDSFDDIASKIDEAGLGRAFAVGMSDYARRAADVEGMRRAAVAVVTLRDAGFPESERATALAFSPWRNPYDDEPLRWDANDAAVVFFGLERGERGEHRFHY